MRPRRPFPLEATDEDEVGIGSSAQPAGTKAADYWLRFGFEPARPIGIEPSRPWPDENWYALRLSGWSPELRGTFH